MKIKTSTLLAYAGLALAMLPASEAAAGGIKTLYTFTGGADGAFPIAGLVAGPHNRFFGTTFSGGIVGGAVGYGTVFELSPPAAGLSNWTLTTLHTFTGGADGRTPYSLAIDANGALYGVTAFGGVFAAACVSGGISYGCGTIFRLSPPTAGAPSWTFTTLYGFTGGSDGEVPVDGLALDGSGNLYGFTAGELSGSPATCAPQQCGTAWQLSPPTAGEGGWTETTLHMFTGGADGLNPYSVPLLDHAGNLYGMTSQGGDTTSAGCLGAVNGCGTVFKLTRPVTPLATWTKKTIWTFDGSDGGYPQDYLSTDGAGDLYGITDIGGSGTACPDNSILPGCGTVFELTPPTAGSGSWTEQVLHDFTGTIPDGAYPWGGVTSASGDLYGTSSGDEVTTFGSIVQLQPPSAGSTTWTEKTLFDFTGDANGDDPLGRLLLRGTALYGTTYGGGYGLAPYGTVFSFTR